MINGQCLINYHLRYLHLLINASRRYRSFRRRRENLARFVRARRRVAGRPHAGNTRALVRADYNKALFVEIDAAA